MTPARHAEIRRVLAAALRWVPAERAAVVAALTGDDAALADEVTDLLAHVVEPEPAADVAAPQPTGLGAINVDGPWPLDRVLERLAPLAAGADEAAGEPEATDDEDEPLWTATIAASRAPEELDPALGPRGPWTEVYVVAVLMVTLLAGRPPAADVAAILARTRDDDAQPTPRALGLTLPPAVDATLTRALARRPLERIQTVPRLFAQLRLAATPVADPAEPSPATSTARGLPGWLLLAGAATVVVALVLALALC